MKVCSYIMLMAVCALFSLGMRAQQRDSVQLYLDSAAQQISAQEKARLMGDALSRAYLLNDLNTIAGVYVATANFEKEQGFFSIALEHYSTAADLYARVQRTKQACEVRLEMLRCHALLSQWSAIETTAATVIEQSKDPKAKAEAHRLWATALCKQGRTDEGIQRLNEAKQLATAQGDTEELAKLELELGACYTQAQQMTLANNAYTNAVTLSTSATSFSWSNTANLNLANNYSAVGDYGSARRLLETAIDNDVPMQPIAAKAALRFELGKTLLATNDLEGAESAINDGFRQLIQVRDTALVSPADSSLERGRLMRSGAFAYKQLADQFARNGNEAKALTYYKRYAALQDSVNASLQRDLSSALALGGTLAETQARIRSLEMERELSNASILSLEDEKRAQKEQLFLRNTVIAVLVILFVLLLGGGYWLWRTQRAKRKADQLLALQSLTGQMNPHFIFNALNSVNEYIAQNDERAANRYLTSFSRLMRQVLDDSRQPFIPVQEEVNMLQVYLQLEHARFAEKFDYVLNVSEEVKNAEHDLPPMLVQPFVENAIWHGLRYRTSKGKLEVNFSMLNGVLVVSVKDDGIGIERSKSMKTAQQKKQHSVGMANTATRIQLINEVYQTNIRVEVSEAMPASEAPGTLVTLSIPFFSNTVHT